MLNLWSIIFCLHTQAKIIYLSVFHVFFNLDTFYTSSFFSVVPVLVTIFVNKVTDTLQSNLIGYNCGRAVMTTEAALDVVVGE